MARTKPHLWWIHAGGSTGSHVTGRGDTGSDVTQNGVSPGARMRNRKLGGGGFPYFFPLPFQLFIFLISLFFLHFFIICFHFFSFFCHTCLTSSKTSFSSPFTGYLSAIFMGSAFNNYISYKKFVVFGYVV
jgi:hypothetical protein